VNRARLAVAGLGRMGRVHAANVAQSCPSAELAWVFDPDIGLAERLAGELGANAARSYEELLADPSLDGVVIASPTPAHASMAVLAAEAAKHVFCEKPVSLSRPETRSVTEASEAAGTGLQVGFHRRFDPSMRAAAERARAGALGQVVLFRATQRDKAPPAPEFLARSGGVFVDMGIHDFDAARWLVGEVKAVSAQGISMSEAEDYHTVAAVLEFTSGALGVVDVSRVAGYGYDSFVELMGDKATVRVDAPYSAQYEWREPGFAAKPLVERFDQRYADAFAAELEHFARCVLAGYGFEPTGRDALAAFDIAVAAAESARRHEPVPVPVGAGQDGKGQEQKGAG
jgi:predicted dehydrogenase